MEEYHEREWEYDDASGCGEEENGNDSREEQEEEEEEEEGEDHVARIPYRSWRLTRGGSLFPPRLWLL